tara:strand:+ start:24124 stop:25641 length:1518 start_codon:yes stop_codon:yes gene_type:complete
MKTYLNNAFSFLFIIAFIFSSQSCTNDALFVEAILATEPESEPPVDPVTNEDPVPVENPSSTFKIPEGSYYVTVSGKSTNDGLSEANAWDIEYAFSNAKAGDYVFIKSGNYGNIELRVKNPGTSSEPLRFIGYTSTPGDIIAEQGSTFKYGDQVDPNVMPLLQATRTNNEGNGNAINISQPYVEISNFQIKNYISGLSSYGEYNVVNNIIVVEVGDFNPAHSYPTGTSNAFLNYNGIGIAFNGEFSTLKNCFVLNSGSEGYRFYEAQNQTHSYNQVYSDNNINPTDYYYLFSTGSSNNEISNIHVERIGNLEHGGHGLVLKTLDVNNNNFYDCLIKNTNVELSYSGVKNNSFIRCKIIGGDDGDGGLSIANGANNNSFINCVISNNQGVMFADWDETVSLGDVKNAGHNNKFFQCEIKDMIGGVNFYWYSVQNSEIYANDNIFEECTFSNLDNLFIVDRANLNTKFINCSVVNVKKLRDSYYPTIHSSIPLNIVHQNTTYENSDF